MTAHRSFDPEENLDILFVKLTEPTPAIAAAFNNWENDPALIPLIRPNPTREALLKRETTTVGNLRQRIEHHHIYLIYWQGQLIGEMDYQVDPQHLYKKESGTAWLGITIGEESGRGKGIGLRGFQYLEEQVKQAGLKRMELGVFEFNEPAIRLYQRAGLKEIGRIDKFTFWQDKMWQDIRMEKYIRHKQD